MNIGFVREGFLTSSLFRSEAIEYKKNRLYGEVLILPSISHIIIVIFLTLWVAGAFYWLFSSTFTNKETVGGWLEPHNGLIPMYFESQSGKIESVLVNEGDYVEKGQELVAFNREQYLGKGDFYGEIMIGELKTQMNSFIQQLESNNSINTLKIKDVNQQIVNLHLDIEYLDVQISTVKKRKEIQDEKVNHFQNISEQGHISKEVFNLALEDALALESELQTLLRNKIAIASRIKQLNNQVEILPKENKSYESNINLKISEIKQKIISLKSQKVQVIRAPQAGYVTNILIKKGHQVKPNSPILTIVPKEFENLAKLLIPVRAIGFIEKGQPIDIRYNAFPYQKFGIYSGVISSISKSVILPNDNNASLLPITEPVYLAYVELNQQKVVAYGTEIPLKAGMTFSADIQLSQRSMIEWVLEPIYSLKGRL